MTAAGAVIIAALVAMPAVSADRLPGKDVMALLERIHNERDRFEDQLDGKIKSSIIRGEGEVHVGSFLDDLQENVDRLKSRFNSDYAASAEVTTVLRQGTDIQRFMSKQPPDLDGASEWNRLASSLGELAKVYATTFPFPKVSRRGDSAIARSRRSPPSSRRVQISSRRTCSPHSRPTRPSTSRPKTPPSRKSTA